jgi:sarcosine oxidase
MADPANAPGCEQSSASGRIARCGNVALCSLPGNRGNEQVAGSIFDFAVIGAGCFGAWTAHELRRAGHSVVLLDAWGAAHGRASSGGESRIIRMGYGGDELYTRWSQHSLAKWDEFSARLPRPILHRSGMLWLSGETDGYVRLTQRTLARLGVAHAELSVAALGDKFPQIALDGIAWALWEPGSGVLMARRAVQELVAAAVRNGVDYRHAAAAPPHPARALERIVTPDGSAISASMYVFACGPWLPKIFPELLGTRIFPTRQEVYFFAPPPGDASFTAAAMPAWFHHPALVYGLPDMESRGFKISIDRHGPAFDPDTGSRAPSTEGMAQARAYLEQRFPKLRGAPLSESRVCQYENTSNGDFILDRHPQIDNVFIAGGGSGHGFKHGPAVGDYVRRMLTTSDAPEARFALTAKATVQQRSVY